MENENLNPDNDISEAETKIEEAIPVNSNGISNGDPRGQSFNPGSNNNENTKTENVNQSADAVYMHSSFGNSYGNGNAANQQAQDSFGQGPTMADQTIPTPAPFKEDKKKETTFRKGRLAISFACVILATSIITSAVSYSIWNHYGSKDENTSGIFSSQTSTSNSSQSNSASSVSNPTGVLTIAEINKKVNPSVVFIGVEVTQTNAFGQQGTASGSGSGIVLSQDGYILTNFHVIDGAKNITVKTIDEKSYTAKVAGSDSKTDLAVLKIDATNLSPATFGDSSKVEVGDLAVVIGNPLGTLDGTLTVGVISALNRPVTIDTVSMSLMQTDAAVNPGNSGGALANAYGEVIGIVNAKTSAVGIEGLGYAIPINDVKPIVNDLMTNGYVTGRLKMGITTKDITADLASYYSLPVGIYVTAVEKGSAAEKAGILAKDVILGVDGKEVLTTEALAAIKDSHKVGDSIKILINRDGKEMSVTLIFEQDIPVLGN